MTTAKIKELITEIEAILLDDNTPSDMLQDYRDVLEDYKKMLNSMPQKKQK